MNRLESWTIKETEYSIQNYLIYLRVLNVNIKIMKKTEPI